MRYAPITFTTTIEITMRLWLLLLSPAYSSEVLINEILYDAASGDDEGTSEWIELCNPGQADVDVSGWSIENAGSSWSEVWLLSEGNVVPAGGYLLIGPGAGDVDEFSPNLQNGGSETDGLRLVMGKTVVDTVLYDSNNSNKLVDDLGSAAGPFAPDVSAGNTLARYPDCTESTNDGDDWAEQTEISPGWENPGPEECFLADGAGVLINEYMADPPDSDSDFDREWIELYNPGTADADLSGWFLEYGTQGFTSSATLSLVVPAGGYAVIGGEDAVDILGGDPDQVVNFSLGQGSNIDGFRISDCDGVVYDTVLYGGSLSETDEWVDDLGEAPTSVEQLSPEPSEGISTGRMPNGVDTDDSGVDFLNLEDFSSPWAANDEEVLCDGQDDIKINEFLPNPDSDSTAADDQREWIELFNNSDMDIDLDGWTLEWKTSGSSGGSYTFFGETLISSGGFLVLGGALVPEADVIVSEEDDISMGGASSSSDIVRLRHCGGGVADTVVYGDADNGNGDEWVDDGGDVATSFAPKPSAGVSLARRGDGEDTDDSGEDFVVSYENTPGAANPIVHCDTTAGFIKINEILPNPSGTDSDYEWIEIINTGDSAIYLDSWTIEAGSSSWSERYTFPPESLIEAGAIVLVGEQYVPEDVVDFYTESSLSLGNASTGLDGVRILDCPGTVVDTLLYAKDDAAADKGEEPWMDDAGGQSAAGFPDENMGLGRYPDGEDTDDNAVDFVEMTPTPGQDNALGSGGDDTGGGSVPAKCGCAGEPSADSDLDPEGPNKCSTMPLRSGPLWLATLLVLVRRRMRL